MPPRLSGVCCLSVLPLCVLRRPQVAVQTRPGFAKGLSDGMPKLIQAEGVGT